MSHQKSQKELANPTKLDIEEPVIVGGQEGIYPAKSCVDLNTTLKAAKAFAELGAMEESRTYALYKRITLCINENTLFQALKNHPGDNSDRLKSTQKSSLNAWNPYPIFGSRCQCVSPNSVIALCRAVD